jgi:hypothetical protein
MPITREDRCQLLTAAALVGPVRFMVDKAALDRFLELLGFSLSVSFYCCSTFINVSSGRWTVGLLVASFTEI